MIRALTLLAASSFVSVAVAGGGDTLANGKSGCKMAAQQEAMAALEAVRAATGDKVELAVTGMTCGSCAGMIQTALAGIDGVQAAYVDHASGTAKVAFDGKKTSLDALVAAIGAAGEYTAAKKADALN